MKFTKYEWISNMKKLFENWRKHLNEGAVPHSAKHVVTKMRTTNPESTAYTNEGTPTPAAIAALKSLTHKLSDEEAENWLERHKDQMKDAEKEMNNELD